MQEDPTISSQNYVSDGDVKELFFLFEKAPFAMSVLKGPSLIIEMANQKLLEIWGKKKGEVIGKPLFECFPELIRTQSEKIFRTVFESGDKFVAKEYETSFLRNGESYNAYFDLNIDPIIRFDGTVTGLLATSTEVTEQVLSRKRIEEREQQLQLITDAMPSLISYINYEERYQFNNKGYEKWFGLLANEIKGKTIREVVGEKAYQNLEPHIKKVLTGQTVSYEAWAPYKEGGERYISATYIPRIDERNNVLGFYALVNDITDKKQAEKSIEESSKKYLTIFESAEVSLWEEDFTGVKAAIDELKQRGIKNFRKYFHEHPEFVEKAMSLIRVLDVNEATIKMFEAKDKSELLGSLPKIFTSESVPAFIEELVAVAEGKTTMESEALLNTVKGNLIYALFTMKLPLPDEKFDRVLFSLLNITERKKAEQKIRESEEKNRLFIEHAPAAMAMFDKEMRYISASNQWMKEYDLQRDIIGKKHYDLFPNILQRWKEVHSRCMKGAVEKAEEDYYVKDNGTPVWLKWEVYPWYQSRDEIGGIVIFTENISERKKAEQAIKESEERFRMLATEAPLFVWLTNEKLQTTYLNKAGQEYFDVKEPFDTSTLSWKKYIHPDDLSVVLDIMNNAAKNHMPYTLEMRLKNGKTGEYRWFLDKGQPRYENEKFIGFIGTSLDIHQKLRAEKQEQKKQKKALQKALQNDKLKSDFIKMASHELKTPVTSIKGFVQLLLTMINESKEKELSPLMVRSSLVSIERQVNRLTRLMSELLDLSRLESGQFELSLEEYSLNELMIDIVQDILYTRPKQQINLYHEFECKIFCDKDRLSQAVMNLLMNAIKYSPGTEKIDVTIKKFSEALVAISIVDYGIGINKKDHEKIFERFYRVEGKTEITYQGFGIGLYITREIIHLHGGSIAVKSEKGKGSDFTFTLPFKGIKNKV